MKFFKFRKFVVRLLGACVGLGLTYNVQSADVAVIPFNDIFLPITVQKKQVSAPRCGSSLAKQGIHVREGEIRLYTGTEDEWVFLKGGKWFNIFYEGSDDGGQFGIGRINPYTDAEIIAYLDFMQELGLNFVLIKTALFVVADDGATFFRDRLDRIHWFIQQAQARGIYVQVNMFDTWMRHKGTCLQGQSSCFLAPGDNAKFPINPWSSNINEIARATSYVKKITTEYCHYANVFFELGNEMDHATNFGENSEQFLANANMHYLPAYYAIAGTEKPIGLSEEGMWRADVNLLLRHSRLCTGFPAGIERKSRPILSNELVEPENLWNPDVMANPEFFAAYKRANNCTKVFGHAGTIGGASWLDIRDYPYRTGPVRKVYDYVSTR